MNESIKMKRIVSIISAFLLILVCAIIGMKLTGRGDTSQVNTYYTVTDNHSAREIEAAMKAVKRKFRAEFIGCTLTDLWYPGDSMAEEEALCAAQYDSQEVIVLLSNFQPDSSGGDGSLTPNAEYTNYQWVLVKNALGQWTPKTWGYG